MSEVKQGMETDLKEIDLKDIEMRDMLYEGKAKKMFRTNDEKQLLVVYKDDATAFNGEKKGTILGKGQVNCEMSALLFRHLEAAGIPTHLIKSLTPGQMLVKTVTILPVEVIVRNIATGSLSKRLGAEEGKVLPHPILEFCYKNDALGDPLVNDDHITALGWATKEQLAVIRTMALKVNELLQPVMLKAGLRLVDFKLEFGLYDGEVILADEISPDTCRLWDAATGKKLDKDRFRQDLGQVEEAYEEVLKRLRQAVMVER
ncbi:phosphoribosylaminoimidazolesuccinocarboxamide synthase [Anoxynatronum sibiricum]|uniref:Phosphoribosylaminoimidazole-succinocarboxamide synthase n=1 Tax=Anoxynatronum sibiricum TaxID=210623 RepID=A0ABU9VWV9_9CLOT